MRLPMQQTGRHGKATGHALVTGRSARVKAHFVAKGSGRYCYTAVDYSPEYTL